MSLHIAGYEIVMGPAGMIVLAVCFAILVLGVAAIVRGLLRRGQRDPNTAGQLLPIATRSSRFAELSKAASRNRRCRGVVGPNP